jgi:hypothetical protein
MEQDLNVGGAPEAELNIPLRDYLSSVLPGLSNLPVKRVSELTPSALLTGKVCRGRPQSKMATLTKRQTAVPEMLAQKITQNNSKDHARESVNLEIILRYFLVAIFACFILVAGPGLY